MATDMINLDMTVLRGVICRKCGNELPTHTCREHLDKTNPIHVCPHNATEFYEALFSQEEE